MGKYSDLRKVTIRAVPVKGGGPSLLVIATRRDMLDMGSHVFPNNPPLETDTDFVEYTQEYPQMVWLEIDPFEGIGEHDAGEKLKLYSTSIPDLIRLFLHLKNEVKKGWRSPIALGVKEDYIEGTLMAVMREYL